MTAEGIDFVKTEDCQRRTDEIKKLLHSIERRLFRDNGNVSIQTRLDRHEQIIGTMRRVLWIATTAIVGLALASVWGHIKGEMSVM